MGENSKYEAKVLKVKIGFRKKKAKARLKKKLDGSQKKVI